MITSFNGALVIREQNGRAFYEAKWRDSRGRQVKRRVGGAWVERDQAGRWRRRGGRVADGCFDEKAAIVEMRRLVDEREEQLAAGPEAGAVTFDQVAADWLHHVEHVDGIKPSTLITYGYMLRPPGASARKRGRRKAGGRVLAEFGGQPIATITTAQVERWLARLDQEPISKRTINIHRQLVCSILGHAACRPDQYGIETNVARATSKRREPDPVVLDFYEPEEVAALARAARAGAHRDPSRPAISEAEREERRRADDQDAALFIVAAFTGLRMGELLELRWRYVSFERATLTVAASWSGGEVTSPKSRKPRTVPLATPPAAELARLAERRWFIAPDDLVFCSTLGDHLDPSALRRRLRRAQEAAGLRPLRFHDLRHSFGSLVVREVDTATLKAWMGHAKLTTTERYLHAKPRHTDVARLDRAFATQPALVGAVPGRAMRSRRTPGPRCPLQSALRSRQAFMFS
jgi:integrase